jgi:hypothetical protein
MKEIIYLDTDLMNSMLAQLDKGIITSFSFEESNQETETEGQQSGEATKTGVEARLEIGTGLFPGGKARIGGKLGGEGNSSFSTSKQILEGEKDILNKAFHDHSLEILTKKLLEKKLLKDGPDFTEGDLHLGEATYRFFDFELIKNVMDVKHIQNIMLYSPENIIKDVDEAIEILERQKKGKKTFQDTPEKQQAAQEMFDAYQSMLPSINLFRYLESFGTYASKALGNSAVIQAGNKVGLIKKQYLRESSEALSFRADQNRHIKFIVRILRKKDYVSSENNMPILKSDELDAIPNLIFDILLGSFDIVKEGDYLVTPIAIYYE